jgi:hypothetical protein
MRSGISLGLLCVGLATLAGQAGAQQRLERFSSLREEVVRPDAPNPGRTIRVAKWATLVAALGSAAYGLSAQHTAGEKYDELELRCQAEPARCQHRNPDGSYTDPDLERLYQEALDRDRASKISLIGSQVGLAASVVLFMLDMRDDDTPRNIPYEPSRFRVGSGERGGTEFRITVPAGRQRRH